MSATHSTHWFWSDWLGDQEVRRLTLAERGVWADLLALAGSSNQVGYICDRSGVALPLEEINYFVRALSIIELAAYIEQILSKGAIKRDRAGRLYFPKMIQDGTAPKRPPRHKWEKLRLEVFKRDNFTCQYCGETNAPLECDHVVPISRRGSNKLKNLATACRACNQAKGALRPEEWSR